MSLNKIIEKSISKRKISNRKRLGNHIQAITSNVFNAVFMDERFSVEDFSIDSGGCMHLPPNKGWLVDVEKKEL